MTVLAQILDVNDANHSWWADMPAANDDGTCPAPAPREPTATGAELPCDAAEGPHAPAPPWIMQDGEHHPPYASANACPMYGGDLWADVLEYRAMRAQALGGTAMTRGQRERFTALESLLRGATNDVRRQFLRFACRYHATIELATREQLRVTLLDASAGGVKAECATAVREGDPVVLVLDPEGVAGSIALPARIIWVRSGFVGLMFAGAAQWR